MPSVQVAARDAQGDLVTDFTAGVTIALGANPGGASLSGTLTVAAVGGVATFSDVSVDRGEEGYSLDVTSGSLTGATSTLFDVAELVTPYALPFYVCLDLETGASRSCALGEPGIQPDEDFWLPCCAQGWPAVFHNQGAGAEIAHLLGSSFEGVHLADTAGAGFSSSLSSEPFDTLRTVLIRTGAGNVYKLGNPVQYGPQGSDSTVFDTAPLD